MTLYSELWGRVSVLCPRCQLAALPRAGRAALVLLSLAATAAWAGPPYLTDDPDIPPPGGWEINVPFILERTTETDMEAPLFDINYGMPAMYGLPHVQLKLEIPVEVVRKADGGTEAGPGDMLLGVKWPFLEEQGWRPVIGVYPQLLVPTGDASRGLGEGRPAYALPALAEKHWGKWTVYGDVGYVVQTAVAQPNYWYEGLFDQPGNQQAPGIGRGDRLQCTSAHRRLFQPRLQPGRHLEDERASQPSVLRGPQHPGRNKIHGVSWNPI